MVRIQTNMFSGALMWAFLPKMATNFIQARYYEWKYAPNSPSKPKQGSPKYKRDYKKIHILVILVYLIYNFYQSMYQTPRQPTLYETLNVSKDFTTQQLKSNYRKLSLMYHPDKQEPENMAEAQEKYILIRSAYEILQKPIQLKAYEKFGITALECKHCSTERDYLYYMIPAYVMHYAITGLVLFIFFVIFGKGYGRYWRFLVYFGTAAFEANILIADHDPISFFLPKLLVFEKIEIIRQLNVTFFIALTHIGPDLIPEKHTNVKKSLKELNKLSMALDKQYAVQFVQGYEPFENNPEALNLLQRTMGKLAADIRLFEFKEVQQVFENMRKSKGSNNKSASTNNNNTNHAPESSTNNTKKRK
ncbi:DnaJ-domain-containing protein [Anaeromyces robustus]|uniref:DnaJ-domain-containing protein n=1 Tax=Anaeromyces robustus TaxID=1754192 RepID=A0A1Y1WUD5_9FUNG|nr:DnaJ-domain-containing protein [Anaeromyces robustus]|eukprot:ORX77160.1 DnaJ-domain-containing protein [Anaeromyces robustus]